LSLSHHTSVKTVFTAEAQNSNNNPNDITFAASNNNEARLSRLQQFFVSLLVSEISC